MLGPMGVLLTTVVSVCPLFRWLGCECWDTITDRDRGRSSGSSSDTESASLHTRHHHDTSSPSSPHTHHSSFLWVYGSLYSPPLALYMNLTLLVLASALEGQAVMMRNTTLLGVLLWLGHQGFVKYEMNFVLAIFFLLFGGWVSIFLSE